MIRVLVVDDEPLTGAAHAQYVARCPGFEVSGVARNGRSALHALRERAASRIPVDLVLLDVNLPDMSGLEVAHALRTHRVPVDLLVVTAHRDAATVREAMSVGAVGFLMKPFTFENLRVKLVSYAQYRRALDGPDREDTPMEQADVDRLFTVLEGQPAEAPPKGLAAETLAKVAEHMRSARGFSSAGEVALGLGLSRVTARRYLEHMCDTGEVERRARRGAPGRPELEYGWRG